MQLVSPAFENGGVIPGKYTGDSSDFSPPLKWSQVPSAAESFALICEDPDAPSRAHPRAQGPWVHWVLYNIPAGVRELPEALPRIAHLNHSVKAMQGRNDFASDNIGYRGPKPPKGSGEHRYYFRLYALDCHLDLDPGHVDKESLLNAIEGHVVARAEWMGIYGEA